jgi:hypothetical protein
MAQLVGSSSGATRAGAWSTARPRRRGGRCRRVHSREPHSHSRARSGDLPDSTECCAAPTGLNFAARDPLLDREFDQGGQLCLRPPPQAAPWTLTRSFLRERPVSPFTGRSTLLARSLAYPVRCASGSAANGGWAVNSVRNGDVSRGSAAETTLSELAEKLSELREQLDQVLVCLNDLREDDRAIREAAHLATPRRRFGQASTEAGSLRCHECGRRSSTDQAGWTLRLCGDDELHPFCPACDRRRVHGNGGGRQPTESVVGSAEQPVMHDLLLTAEQSGGR